MKSIIKGQNYNFCIVMEEGEFYIEAIHNTSLRYSFINNLNPVLSEFNIDVEDEMASESQWLISNTRQEMFFLKKAVNFLSDKTFRDYVEIKLDEDRKYSEWENIKEKMSL